MPSYQATLDDFLHSPARRGKRATLGAYTLYLNPDSIEGNAVRSHLEYVTLNGGGSFRYPVLPEVWKLAGHTGIKGADELEAMYGQVAPSNARAEKLVAFTFAPLFRGTLYVLVNSFTRAMANDRHLYCAFQAEVLVLPKPRQPSYRTLSSDAATALAALLAA